MRIAVLTTISRRAGGLFYSVRSLSKALVVEGCNPIVFSPRDQYSEEDVGVWFPLHVYMFPAFGPLQSSLAMRRRVMSMHADLVHVHGIWLDSQWAAMIRQKKEGSPSIVSPRGMLDSWAVRNSSWKKRLVEKLFAREALEHATCIHALCRSEAESIRAYGLKNPIAVIPNGVELPDIGSQRTDGGSRNSANDAKKRLLFLGRIHPKKGLRELIEAWGAVQGAWRKDWQLMIAGWDDGGLLDGLKKQAATLGLWKENADGQVSSIQFVGPKYGEEKDDLLRSVDAFILPSYSEGLPMSVLEAWSYGLPVLMTDLCNLPEGFEAGAALRIEPLQESIARGIGQLAAMSDAERGDMGLLGRSLVEKRFAWPKIAAEMKQVYEWCLSGINPPDCMEFNKANE